MAVAFPNSLRLALVFAVAATGCSRSAPASPPQLRSIWIAAPIASFPLGTRLTVTAFGTYTDGSKRDLTSQLQWSTPDPTMIRLVAREDGRIEVRAQKQGVALVQAFLGNDSASIPLHVTDGALSGG